MVVPGYLARIGSFRSKMRCWSWYAFHSQTCAVYPHPYSIGRTNSQFLPLSLCFFLELETWVSSWIIKVKSWTSWSRTCSYQVAPFRHRKPDRDVSELGPPAFSTHLMRTSAYPFSGFHSREFASPVFEITQVITRSHDMRGEGHENPTARILAPIRTLLPPSDSTTAFKVDSIPAHPYSLFGRSANSINTTPRSWLTNTYVCPRFLSPSRQPPRRRRRAHPPPLADNAKWIWNLTDMCLVDRTLRRPLSSRRREPSESSLTEESTLTSMLIPRLCAPPARPWK